MRNKIYVIIVSIVVFLLLGSGLTSYYIDNYNDENDNKQYITRKISWDDFELSKVTKNIKLYDKSFNIYDNYYLNDTDYSEIKNEKVIVTKTVKYLNIDNIDTSKWPKYINYDDTTLLYYNSYNFIPNFKDLTNWNENLVFIKRVYNDINEADLYDIPKVINDDGFDWYMLTDKINFIRKDNKFNCELNYYRVNKNILSKKVIQNYNIDVIYKGEKIKKSGYVNLKYKLTNKNKKKIISKSNLKVIIISAIVIFLILISIDKITKRKEHL